MIFSTFFMVMFSFASSLWAADDLLAGLPPDSGPAGKLTLAGIDSDNDGVRDDVQRWIALAYPNSQKTRAALIQDAKDMQQFLLDAANPLKTFNNAIQTNKTVACFAYIRPNDFTQILKSHKAVFLNTRLRSQRWLQADHHLSGKMFKGLDFADWKKGCNFDPDAVPN